MIRIEFSRQTGPLIRSCSAHAEVCERGIRVECSVAAVKTMLRLGATCIRVQDSWGADVEIVWNTDARRGGMTGHNCVRHTFSEELRLPPGTYTAVVTFYAKNGLGSDSVTVRTDAVTVV